MANRIINDITGFIFMDGKPAPADIILVPGGSYPQLCERAARLFKEGLAPLVLPSGRCGYGESAFRGVSDKIHTYNGAYSTEWEFMADVLAINGVPRERVLKEDRASYTKQNAVYSKQLCDRLQLTINTAILCCKSHHARRAYMYYQLAFPETVFIVVPSDVRGISAQNWHLTREGFSAVMEELEKCGGQLAEDLFAAVKPAEV